MNNKTLSVLALSACAVVGPASLAAAGGDGSVVTSGDLAPFPAATASHPDLDGRAQMVRTASGDTIVTVIASGLEPGATYGAHVHAKPCDTEQAGGHYMFPAPVPGGDHPAGNEIWPGPIAANPAGRGRGKAVVGAVAGPEAVSVVIHAPGGAKVACADLS